MTEKFWKFSLFKETNYSFCHGSAANMFNSNDYRMLLCAKLTLEDFYVIHHEMGHIQYYMAYRNQPTLFQVSKSSTIFVTSMLLHEELRNIWSLKEFRNILSLDVALRRDQEKTKYFRASSSTSETFLINFDTF